MKKILLFIFLLPTLAFAQLELPFPIKLVNPKPVDFWYFESDGTPYDNTGEVTTQVLSAIRYRGMTFNVNGVEYWFKDGITDGDLIVKGGSSLTLVNGNGTTVNGTGDGVDLGGTTSGNIDIYPSTPTTGEFRVGYGNVYSRFVGAADYEIDLRAFNPSGTYGADLILTQFAGLSSSAKIRAFGVGYDRMLYLDYAGTTLNLGSDANQDLFKRNSSGYLERIPLGSSGDVLTNVAGSVGWAAPSGGGGGLTVGTSTITSGTNTKVLYNNSGVLGEYTVSGTGNVALTTSPTFTTPALGTPSALVGTNITGTATGLTSGITNALKSATTTVNVSSATAPTSGQVLTATSGTAATWQTPASASGAWLLASGGTATGTNTFAMGSNPFILTSGVTTGTGATAGIQNVFNSLTTGNGLDISTSSLTTGKGLALTSTSTAINHTWGTNALFSSRISGANANSTRTAIAGEFVATNTGTSATNTAVYAAASGGTNNYSIYASGQMYVEGLTTSGYIAYFKAGGANRGIYINSTGVGVIPIVNNTTDLGNASQQFKNAFFSGNVSTGGITTVLARIHSRGAGTTTGYNLLTENSGATARFGVRDNGAIEFSGSAGTSGQVLTSAGSSSSPIWTDQAIQTVKVTLSSAEILNSFSSAKQLIAAPGSGKVIEVISTTFRYNYLTAPYATNTVLALYYSTVEATSYSGIIDQSISTIKMASTGVNFNSASSTFDNQAVFLGTKTGNPTAGSGTLDVYVTYRIITL